MVAPLQLVRGTDAKHEQCLTSPYTCCAIGSVGMCEAIHGLDDAEFIWPQPSIAAELSLQPSIDQRPLASGNVNE